MDYGWEPISTWSFNLVLLRQQAEEFARNNPHFDVRFKRDDYWWRIEARYHNWLVWDYAR